MTELNDDDKCCFARPDPVSFGTSWMRDWLRAYESADSGLRGSILRFNGATDANFGATPGAHVSHDVGMALDLGFNETGMLDLNNTKLVNDPPNAGLNTVVLADPANVWSKANAIELITAQNAAGNTLLSSTRNNNQVAAIKSFLGLYDITQKNKGSWSAIALSNEVQGTDTIKKALFGDGTKDGGLVNKVHVGAMKKVALKAAGKVVKDAAGNVIMVEATIASQNPLYNIRTVLSRLGVNVTPIEAHHNHFHVYLRVPKILMTPANLLDESANVELAPHTTVETSISIINADENLGVTNMLMPIFDTSTQPIIQSEQVVFISDKAAKKIPASNPKPQLFLEECRGLETQTNSGQDLSLGAPLYFYRVEKLKIRSEPDFKGANIIILKQPEHGVLINLNTMSSFGPEYRYTAKDGYSGIDRFSYIISVAGMVVQVNQILHVVDVYTGEYEKFCANKPYYVKKIGLIENQTNDLALWFAQAELAPLLAAASKVSYSFSDLPATVLGNTTGQGLSAQITLDTTAAGHGWYVDATPLDNTDDYLPTSDPTVFKAKAGSEAEGKMDMLSVLLHEYGHALGLEHSLDASDFMAASLQPGVRKLPSDDELALMARLVAELKGDESGDALSQGDRGQDPANPFAPSPLSVLGLLPMGFIRRSDKAATKTNQTTHTDYLTAINPTLENGNFSTAQNGSIDQWETTGKVDVTPSTITLGESTTAQTHLAQAFVLSAQDRFLTFNVSNLALQNNSTLQNGILQTAPQDAFEVALTNANTGANLMTDPLAGLHANHSDALLNIQLASSDPSSAVQERSVAGLRHTDNADGSRTYVLDLSGIAAGTPVNLSFDLIGFGMV